LLLRQGDHRLPHVTVAVLRDLGERSG
jgi:hypothetical protein